MRICKIDGCGGRAVAHWLCDKHYRRDKRKGLVGDAKCKVDGCSGGHQAHGYCQKHYHHIERHGKVLERTLRDKNIVILHDDYAVIVLEDKYCNKTGEAIIDTESIDKVSKHKWYLAGHDNDRVRTRIDNKGLELQNLLIPHESGVIDHINGNSLDNRMCNLRRANATENACNSGLRKNNTSGVKGVSWCKKHGKWRTRINFKGKEKHIGFFKNIEDAAKARKSAALKIHGEFAYEARPK